MEGRASHHRVSRRLVTLWQGHAEGVSEFRSATTLSAFRNFSEANPESAHRIAVEQKLEQSFFTMFIAKKGTLLART